MAAGFAPKDFWVETPRSFVTIMEGAARAAKSKHDADLSLAWHSAAFNGAVQNGKLKKLSHYLKGNSPKRAQSGSEMLALMQNFTKYGATIRQVH